MPQTPSLILHVDMDSFYVSVERLRDPSLVGKPVVVGGTPDGRGVVASASYEARQFGIRSAMPAAEARRRCPHAVFVRGSMGEYARYSRLIRGILETFTPLVEMASQDEAYLDMAGTERTLGPPMAMVGKVRDAIARQTSLPCSVGAASNRLVAKIASDLCKPLGALWVPSGSEARFLAPLPLSRIPGIGAKTIERLHALGLRHAADLQAVEPGILHRHLGASHADELIERAHGRGATIVTPHADPKSISHETTFEKDEASPGVLSSVLMELAEKVAARLRARDWLARTLTIKYRYSDFETHTASLTLGTGTADERILHREAVALLQDRRAPGRSLRLLGLGTSGFAARDEGQMDLLGSGEEALRRERLLRAMDTLRDKHGFDALRSARTATNKERP